MKCSLRLLGFMKFLQNNNHQAVNKMKKFLDYKNKIKSSENFINILYEVYIYI